MPPATDKADPWGQFLNTFMSFTEGRSHLFLSSAIYYTFAAETTHLFLTARDIKCAQCCLFQQNVVKI